MIPIYPINYETLNQNENVEIEFTSINDHNYGERWKRTGYCSRCGNCCNDSENIFKEFDGNNEPNPLVQVVPGKCAYFRWGEDGLAQCTGRDTLYYKSGCVVSPTKIEHISNWPDCTYRFEKIADGQPRNV